MNDFKIKIIKLPEDGKLTCQMTYKDMLFGQILNNNDEIIIQIFNSPISEYWEFEVDQFINFIKIAKNDYLAAAKIK